MLGWFRRFFDRVPAPPPRREPELPAPPIAAWGMPEPAVEPAPAMPARGRRKLRPRKTRVFRCAVVGESFANDDGTPRQAIIQRCVNGEAILLAREPHNRFDPNAVAVRRAATREQIGYLRRGVAEGLVRDIDNQFAATAIIKQIRNAGPGTLSGVVLEVTLTDARPH